jgi:hypothetical protein
MTTVLTTVFDRRSSQEKTIEEHAEEIKRVMTDHAGLSKAVTILIDENSGKWQLHPVYCNTTNGDVFMALKLMEQLVLNGVQQD